VDRRLRLTTVSRKTPAAAGAKLDGMTTDDLTTVPNVGPAVARRLHRLGIRRPEELRGRDAEELFERLCALDGQRHDPCLLDTFTAAVAFADGGPALPWWHYSRERKAAGRR
jgi:Pathogenicity locus